MSVAAGGEIRGKREYSARPSQRCACAEDSRRYRRHLVASSHAPFAQKRFSTPAVGCRPFKRKRPSRVLATSARRHAKELIISVSSTWYRSWCSTDRQISSAAALSMVAAGGCAPSVPPGAFISGIAESILTQSGRCKAAVRGCRRKAIRLEGGDVVPAGGLWSIDQERVLPTTDPAQPGLNDR